MHAETGGKKNQFLVYNTTAEKPEMCILLLAGEVLNF